MFTIYNKINMLWIIIFVVICLCCMLSSGGGSYYYYLTYLKDYTLYLTGYSVINSTLEGTEPIDNVLTLDNCRQLCLAQPRCQTFAYNVTGKQCTLQEPSNVNNQSNPTPTLMGYKLTNGKYTTYDGYSVNDIFVPNVKEPISDVSQEDCQKACSDTTDCIMYKYQYGDTSKKCYLKKLMKNELLIHGNVDRKNLEK